MKPVILRELIESEPRTLGQVRALFEQVRMHIKNLSDRFGHEFGVDPAVLQGRVEQPLAIENLGAGLTVTRTAHKVVNGRRVFEKQDLLHNALYVKGADGSIRERTADPAAALAAILKLRVQTAATDCARTERRRRGLLGGHSLEDHRPDPEPFRGLEHQELRSALDRLDPLARDILRAYYDLDWEDARIAEDRGLSRSKVHRIRTAALESIRTAFGKT